MVSPTTFKHGGILTKDSLTKTQFQVLVYAYLQESGLVHSAFSLLKEAEIPDDTLQEHASLVQEHSLVVLVAKGRKYLDIQERYLRGDSPALILANNTLANGNRVSSPIVNDASFNAKAAGKRMPSREMSGTTAKKQKLDKGKGRAASNPPGDTETPNTDAAMLQVDQAARDEPAFQSKKRDTPVPNQSFKESDAVIELDKAKEKPASKQQEKLRQGSLPITSAANIAVLPPLSAPLTKKSLSNEGKASERESRKERESKDQHVNEKEVKEAELTERKDMETKNANEKRLAVDAKSALRENEKQTSSKSSSKHEGGSSTTMKRSDSATRGRGRPKGGNKEARTNSRRNSTDDTAEEGDVAFANQEDHPERPTPKSTFPAGRVTVLKGHTAPPQPCEWNPTVEGLLATGANDASIRIWDVPAGVSSSNAIESHVGKHSSSERRKGVTCVAWNVGLSLHGEQRLVLIPSMKYEGSLIATGCEDGVGRIFTASGDFHLVLSMHQREISSIQWNRKGNLIVTGSQDHTVCVFESLSGKTRHQWHNHSDFVLDVDWATNDIFASSSKDKGINVYHAGRNNLVHRFKGHSDDVNCIKFDLEVKYLASGSDDKTVRVWSLAPLRKFLGPKKEGTSTPTPERVEVSDEEEENTALCRVLKGHTGDIHTLQWCPRPEGPNSPKLLASGSFDKTARIWDATHGTCLHVLNRHVDLIYSLAWQPEKGSYLATGSKDSKVCMHRLTSDGKCELEWEFDHGGEIFEIRWNARRNQIAVCGVNGKAAHAVNVIDFDVEAELEK